MGLAEPDGALDALALLLVIKTPPGRAVDGVAGRHCTVEAVDDRTHGPAVDNVVGDVLQLRLFELALLECLPDLACESASALDLLAPAMRSRTGLVRLQRSSTAAPAKLSRSTSSQR